MAGVPAGAFRDSSGVYIRDSLNMYIVPPGSVTIEINAIASVTLEALLASVISSRTIQCTLAEITWEALAATAGVITIPAARSVIVPAESRRIIIEFEDRTMNVDFEDRTLTVR